MKPSKPAQRSAIGAIAAKLGLDKEGKAELVSQYSNGRTQSTTGLSFEEAAEMIKAIQLDAKPLKDKGGYPIAWGNTLRRQVIAIFHEAGWHIDGSAAIDMERVNTWCTNHGHGKKPLNDYTYEELPKLLGRLKSIWSGI